MNPKAESLPPSWDKLHDEVDKSEITQKRRSTETQAENVFASSDEPRSDAPRHLLVDHQATSRSTASGEAIPLSIRENESENSHNLGNSPQLPLVLPTEHESILSEVKDTGAAIWPEPKPSFRGVNSSSTHSEPRYLSESSTQSVSLMSTFRDEPTQSNYFSDITMPDRQPVDLDPLTGAGNRLSTGKSNKLPQNQRKALDDEEITKSAIRELEAKSNPSSGATYTSGSDHCRISQPDSQELHKRALFAGNANSVSRKTRKRSKVGCLSK